MEVMERIGGVGAEDGGLVRQPTGSPAQQAAQFLLATPTALTPVALHQDQGSVDHLQTLQNQLKSIVDNKQGDHEAGLEEIWSKVGKCRNLVSCIQMIQRVATGVAKAPVQSHGSYGL